jgi:hypothetical protein
VKRESGEIEPHPDQLALWPEPAFVEGADVVTRPICRQSPRRVRLPSAVAEHECLWSIKDVGQFLGVPVATIYQWRVRGEGPPATKLGKHLRYEPGVVRAWVSEHREGA